MPGCCKTSLLRRKTWDTSLGQTDAGTPYVNVEATAPTYYVSGSANGRAGGSLTVSTWDGSPGSATATVASGGTIAVGNYYYEVTAITASGETGASVEADASTTTGNQTVNLAWNAYAGATGYNAQCGTSSGAKYCLRHLSAVTATR